MISGRNSSICFVDREATLSQRLCSPTSRLKMELIIQPRKETAAILVAKIVDKNLRTNRRQRNCKAQIITAGFSRTNRSGRSFNERNLTHFYCPATLSSSKTFSPQYGQASVATAIRAPEPKSRLLQLGQGTPRRSHLQITIMKQTIKKTPSAPCPQCISTDQTRSIYPCRSK